MEGGDLVPDSLDIFSKTGSDGRQSDNTRASTNDMGKTASNSSRDDGIGAVNSPAVAKVDSDKDDSSDAMQDLSETRDASNDCQATLDDKPPDNRTIAQRCINEPTACVRNCGYRVQIAGMLGSKKTPEAGMETFCCAGCRSGEDHTLDCEHVELEVLARTVFGSVTWESSRLDYIIVHPKVTRKKTPVLLFLTGVGHICWPQGILNGGVELLTRCPGSDEFCIICPLPDYNMCSSYRELLPEPTWHVFLGALRHAKEECDVDLERLYCTGISMGSSATWDLMSRHGQHFAACVPLCGNCPWGDRWDYRSPLPEDDVWKNLRELAIRHYHVSSDRCKSPYYDFDYLARGRDVRREDEVTGIELPGIIKEATLISKKHVWGKCELWEIDGPMRDWPDWKDNHCIWLRAYPQQEYGILPWLLQHRIAKTANILQL